MQPDSAPTHRPCIANERVVVAQVEGLLCESRRGYRSFSTWASPGKGYYRTFVRVGVRIKTVDLALGRVRHVPLILVHKGKVSVTWEPSPV